MSPPNVNHDLYQPARGVFFAVLGGLVVWTLFAALVV
jgi:hypothetical protein